MSLIKPAVAITAIALSAVALVGCSPSQGTSTNAKSTTFTAALSGDPGSLDPQMSAGTPLFQVSRFAYDPLVNVDAKGKIVSQLASKWTVDTDSATFTLRSGITCSSGKPFTAKTAADNITFMSNPENKSPFLGGFLPGGLTATSEGNTLTLKLAAPAPFLLLGLSSVPMVCDAGLADRASLVQKTDGTGPYVLTEAVPNDHYSYKLRKDYSWGPDGVTGKKAGLPSVLKARIITNQTTAANLLVSGEINAALITGPDVDRLVKSKLFAEESAGLVGEQWYNHASGHPTSDPAVRLALTRSIDLKKLAQIFTSGKGGPATALTTAPPTGCDFNSVQGALPSLDVAAAKSELDAAGWKAGTDGIRAKDGQSLKLTFLVTGSTGSGGTAAAEFAKTAWKKIGVDVEIKTLDDALINEALFGTGAWDIAWVALNVNSPDQSVNFLSGPAAPNGTNFSDVQNSKYEALTTEAMGLSGTKSCPVWKKAEQTLFKAAEIVPFANTTIRMFGKNATFEWLGQIEPTSIKMVG